MARREAFVTGHAVAQLIEALRYKPKGRGSEFFIDRILGSTLTEMSIARAERDGTRAETIFRLSPKWTSQFKSVGASVQSTAGSRGVRISFSNAGYTTFGGGVRVLATHSIRQFPLHFPSRASPFATRFRTSSTRTVSSGVKACNRPVRRLLYLLHQLF